MLKMHKNVGKISLVHSRLKIMCKTLLFVGDEACKGSL